MARDEEDSREHHHRRPRDETEEERRERHERRRTRTGDDRKRRSQASEDEEKRRSKHASRSPKKQSRSPEKKSHRPTVTERHITDSSASSFSHALSSDALARLNAANEARSDETFETADEREKVRGNGQRRYRDHEDRLRHRDQEIARLTADRERRNQSKTKSKSKSKPRVPSGGSVEKASRGSSVAAMRERVQKRKWWIIAAIVIAIIIIVVPVAVTQSKKNNQVSGGGTTAAGAGTTPGQTPSTLGGITQDEVPAWAKGTYYDPFTWYDTVDFNCTITNETVGGLPIMGLNSTWDDSAQVNPNVPALNKNFTYGKTPIRGINVGGWLSIEPFITPSLFDQFPQSANVVDEYTLTSQLGSGLAASTLEKHYSSFINLATFQEIQEAGFDHVRMPFSYWAVTTYDGDPYVKQISWRYLLRGIEYARQCGLRVNLDLHGLPGSQNGWNHSGRQGPIGWLNGTDGDLNAQRSLDIHNQLSQFFAQPRYKNVVAIYGLVNEPKMISLPTDSVLNWTTSAVQLVRKNGIQQMIAFGDGFLGLPKWKGLLPGLENLILDAHQYVIFNTDQIAFDHQTKLNFACSGWTSQMQQSMNTATGYGPTMCGEWSQADTDCATYLNNVNVGSRWDGTMNVGDPSLNVLQPKCPLKTSACSCNNANADPSTYSNSYKQWLFDNAIAQMVSFETGYGWFYWTWLTEKSVQWSYKLGRDAGILPQQVWQRSGAGPSGSGIYNCTGTAPSFSDLPENY